MNTFALRPLPKFLIHKQAQTQDAKWLIRFNIMHAYSATGTGTWVGGDVVLDAIVLLFSSKKSNMNGSVSLGENVVL